MKNKNTIKGISPITNQPFDESDLRTYGWMKDENDLWEKYNHVNAFDYNKLDENFKEFKKHNPELIPKPVCETQRENFKALKDMNLSRSKL
jgi:hypothetical protein